MLTQSTRAGRVYGSCPSHVHAMGRTRRPVLMSCRTKPRSTEAVARTSSTATKCGIAQPGLCTHAELKSGTSQLGLRHRTARYVRGIAQPVSCTDDTLWMLVMRLITRARVHARVDAIYMIVMHLDEYVRVNDCVIDQS